MGARLRALLAGLGCSALPAADTSCRPIFVPLQALANRGLLVLYLRKNSDPSKAGHTAVVRPFAQVGGWAGWVRGCQVISGPAAERCLHALQPWLPGLHPPRPFAPARLPPRPQASRDRVLARGPRIAQASTVNSASTDTDLSKKQVQGGWAGTEGRVCPACACN